MFRQHPHSMVPAVLCSWSGRDHQPTRCVPHASQEGLCSQSPQHTARGPEPARSIPRLTLPRLGDLAVAARAVLGGALGRPDGLGPFEAVALAAAAPGPTGQRVGAPVHHDGVHAIGHREGLEVALDGDGQRELVDEVHGGARNDGPAAEVLQTEHCGAGRGRGRYQMMRGQVMGRSSGGSWWQLTISPSDEHK